jgi:hypothetical protein
LHKEGVHIFSSSLHKRHLLFPTPLLIPVMSRFLISTTFYHHKKVHKILCNIVASYPSRKPNTSSSHHPLISTLTTRLYFIRETSHDNNSKSIVQSCINDSLSLATQSILHLVC